MNNELRTKLIAIALEWQDRYGVAPQITTPLSEYDAAMLVGMPEHEYSVFMQDITAFIKALTSSTKMYVIKSKATAQAVNQGAK